MIWRSVVLVALIAVATAAASPPRDPADTCQACRAFVSFSRKLNSTSQRQEYKNVIEKFCEQYYPPSTDFQTGPCPMFADGFYFLLDSIDPVYHCDEIGACGPVAPELPSDDIYDYHRQAAAPARPNDPALCSFCEGLVSQIKAILTNPKAVEKLKRDSAAFCSYLAVIDEDKTCTEVVNKYLDIALMFVNRLDPQGYCRDLKMCPKYMLRTGMKKLLRPEPQQLPTLADFSNFGLETSVSVGSRPMARGLQGATGGECVFCKTLVKEMFRFLRENKTEANIIEGLNRICHILYPSQGPGFEQCRGLVKAYTRELVELLIDETDPDMICALLGLCVYERVAPVPLLPKLASTFVTTADPPAAANSLNLGDLISALEPQIRSPSSRSCVECKLFISYIKSVLEDPKSEEEVREWLQTNLCQIMPEGSLRDTCSSMVDAYSATFFKVLAGDLSPQAACVELHACKPRSFVQVLNLNDLYELPSPACDRCTLVVGKIDEFLASRSAGHDISELSSVCENLASHTLRNECNTIVQENGLEIIQLVPNMENPRQVCRQIMAC